MIDIRYLVISDIHLGNRRNKTTEILHNLNVYFDHYNSSSQFTEMDIIFIAGDLFDTLLDFSNSDIHEITSWMGRLMYFCFNNNIKLRLLEGTPSHDWGQSKICQTLKDILKLDLDFKYVEKLHIEHMEDKGLHILYIPDEWTSSADLTFSQVKELMKDNNISEVDIAIMHGAFDYQLKNIPGNGQKHSEGAYLGIVKHFINIGHIHTFSNYDKIIAEGSFDRMSHGEEEAKGGVVCTIAANGNNYFNFIENKGAKIFKTITIRNADLDKAFATVHKALSKIPENSFVRIKAKKDHPLYVAFEELKLKYPMYYFSKTALEDEAVGQQMLSQIQMFDSDYSPITITPGNIVDMLTSSITSKYDLNDGQLNLLSGLLGATL